MPGKAIQLWNTAQHAAGHDQMCHCDLLHAVVACMPQRERNRWMYTARRQEAAHMLRPRDRLACCSASWMWLLNMLTRSSKRTVSVTSPLLILYMARPPRTEGRV